ncbi:hypothetical protein FRC12_001042 [Ceratobasidium sp. 428]|nr:hypothetical protein FRC12_001042 [Ceratobasidium sp. 428]
MSLFLRGIPRLSVTTRTLGISITSARGISGQTSFDKYFAPYPTQLPKVHEHEQQTASPSPKAEPKHDIYQSIINLPTNGDRTPEERWASVHTSASRDVQDPGNVYTGRSVPVLEKTGLDVAAAYRRLHVILSRNRVRSELFLQRRYEKPSDRERRLKSERHRRRFAAWIRKKVQLVSEIRRRG